MIRQSTRFMFLSKPFILAFAALLLMSPAAFSQTDTGRIVGTVTDSSGAVVPGATILIRNERTGEERTATASDEGVFLVPSLRPSFYSVTASAANFANAELTNVQVSVGQELNLDLTLNVAGGGVNTIDVVASEAAIDTSSAKIGATVNEREVEGLPLNGRQLSQLYLQAPGSINSGSGTFGDIRFSGRAVQQNVVRYDGIEGTAIIDASPGNLNGETPSRFRLQTSLENVQEFRVDSSNYPAEFGTGTGGQVNVITKSGGNRFSGSLFEYLRNDVLDARNFFDLSEKSPLRLNQFGGSIGGPIVKDRAFFFFSYEGYRLRSGINFIEAAPSLRFAQPGALIPGTTTLVNPGVQPLIAAFRTPNAAIVGTSPDGNFDIVQLNSSVSVNEDAFAGRLDFRLNESNTLYARFFRDDAEAIEPEGVTGRNTFITATPQNGIISLQSTIAPTVLNEFKFGYNGARTRVNAIAPIVNGIDLSSITINTSGQIALAGIAGQGGGNAGLAQPGGLVRANSATNGRGQPYTPYSLSFIDNVNLVNGNHNTRFGGEVRLVRLYTDRLGGTTYTFNGLNGFLANTPTSIQYLGDVSAPSPFNGGATGERLAKQEYYIAYAQDEWKIRPNITLSYGLRYEYYTPLREARDLQILFDINTGQFRDPSEAAFRSSKSNFGPRVAFTYAPNFDSQDSFFGGGRTVLRGGFGIYYGPGQTEDQIQPIESDRVSSTLSNNSVTPLIFPVNTAAIVANFAANPGNRQYQPRAYANEYEIPEKIYQYSFSLQQELPYKLVGTAAYVGSQGRNLFLRSIANTILPGQATIASSANTLPTGTGVVNLTNAAGLVTAVRTVRQFSTISGNTVLNPFAEVDYKTVGGSDSYNALQTSLARRFNSGLTLNSQYTFARSYGNTAGSNEARTSANPFDFDGDIGFNNFDVRHSFNASALYALPFGKGQRYDLGGVGNALLGNFEIGGIINARSGLPIEVNIVRPDVVAQCTAGPCQINATTSVPTGFTVQLPTVSATQPLPQGFTAVVNTPGGGSTRNLRRPNLVAGVPLYLNNDRNLINPAAFSIPAAGAFGDLPRNALRGPNFNQFDMVFNKRFALTENTRLEFRTEIFNIFNRTNFSNPANSRLAVALPTLNFNAATGAYAIGSGVQPGQPYSPTTAGGNFGVLTSTVERTVGLGTNRQIQFALRLNF